MTKHYGSRNLLQSCVPYLGSGFSRSGFSLANFFANGGKEILINSAAQYGGYIAATAVGNSITPEILIPVFANSKLATDFLQLSNNLPGQPERVATVALVFSTAGLLTKTGDIPTNATMGALIAAFADYMGSVVNSGNVPFFYRRPKRMNLTFKQHMQMQLLLLGLLVAISGVIYFTKSLIRRSWLFFKKLIKTIKKFRKTYFNNNLIKNNITIKKN
jgi:hypothetical protein